MIGPLSTHDSSCPVVGAILRPQSENSAAVACICHVDECQSSMNLNPTVVYCQLPKGHDGLHRWFNGIEYLSQVNITRQ